MNIPRHCDNCRRKFAAKLSNVVAGRGRYCSRICFDQARRIVRPDICIDDPVRTPQGRPAVVRDVHNDGRIDIRYTDELADPGCTLSSSLLVRRRVKTPSAPVPRPSAMERGWLPGQQW